jgi:RNA polymerase-binding transcription factor DksA
MHTAKAPLTSAVNDPVSGLASSVEHMRDLLEAERTSTMHRIVSLTRQFDAIVESCALTTNDDEHDPEGVTVAFERAQVAALRARAREHLVALDRSAERLRDGTYGVCERCGQAIAHERLVALPAVQTCIGCATRIRR